MGATESLVSRRYFQKGGTAPARFYYSTDGLDSLGPVTAEEVRRLVRENQIGASSFLCLEGEETWKPLDLEVYGPPAEPEAPPVRAVKKSLSDLVKVPVKAPAKAPVKTSAKTPAPKSRAPAILLNCIGGVVGCAGLVLCALMTYPPPGEPAMSFRLGAFVATLVGIFLVPALVCLVVKGFARVVVRTVGIVLMALLMVGAKSMQSGAIELANAHALSERQKESARQEIAKNGIYTGNVQQAEQNVAQIKAQFTGDSETARIGREVVSVTSDLVAKVKASDDAEKSCDFTLKSAKSADDLATQGFEIAKWRDTQSDVVDFLQAFDQHCRDALAPEKLPAGAQDEVIAGARKGAHVELLISLWQEKMALSEDHIARFNFLRKEWGQWELKDDQVIFKSDTDVDAYNALMKSLQDDVEKIRGTQKQIFE